MHIASEKMLITLTEEKWLFTGVFRASLIEPHTYEEYGEFVCLYISIRRLPVAFYLSLPKWPPFGPTE